MFVYLLISVSETTESEADYRTQGKGGASAQEEQQTRQKIAQTANADSQDTKVHKPLRRTGC